MTATAETSPPAAPDTAKDAARLLHAQLELLTWHARTCLPSAADSQFRLMVAESLSLLEITRGIAGRAGS